MTHFEKENNEEKNNERHPHKKHHHENKHHEDKTKQNHEKKHEPKKDSCCGMGLNGFQKFLAVIVIIQVLLLIFIAVKMSALSAVNIESNDVADVPTPSAEPSNNKAPTVNMDALIDDDSVKGDKNAPITIVEFSDYECPFCERFYSETFAQINEKYIKTGKVKFVYRDFPLNFHQNAQKAAEAAECAGEQDKYFEMHDLLFEKGVSEGVNSFKQYAKELKLDTTKFDQCLDSGAMAQEVQKDFVAGQQAGVSGTPAFFINGKELVGAQPFQAFKQIIENELNS